MRRPGPRSSGTTAPAGCGGSRSSAWGSGDRRGPGPRRGPGARLPGEAGDGGPRGGRAVVPARAVGDPARRRPGAARAQVTSLALPSSRRPAYGRLKGRRPFIVLPLDRNPGSRVYGGHLPRRPAAGRHGGRFRGHKTRGRRHMAGDEGPMAAERLRVEPDGGQAREARQHRGAHRVRAAPGGARAPARGRTRCRSGGCAWPSPARRPRARSWCRRRCSRRSTPSPSTGATGACARWLFGIARRICGRHVEMRARREARLRLVHDTGRGPRRRRARAGAGAGAAGARRAREAEAERAGGGGAPLRGRALVPRAGGGVRGGRGGGAQAGEPGAVASPGGSGRGVGR